MKREEEEKERERVACFAPIKSKQKTKSKPVSPAFTKNFKHVTFFFLRLIQKNTQKRNKKEGL